MSAHHLQVRSATRTDMRCLVELYTEASTTWLGTVGTLAEQQAWQERFCTADEMARRATPDGQVVGTIWTHPTDTPETWAIHGLYCRAARTGAGSALLRAAANHARAHNAARLIADSTPSNTAAATFFTRHGFKSTEDAVPSPHFSGIAFRLHTAELPLH